MIFRKKNDDQNHRVGIYCLYDAKSEVFAIPQFIKNRGLAERAMMEGLKDPNATMTKYPADFTLFEVGEYDEQTATFYPHEAKINLGTALEFLRKLEYINKQAQGEQKEAQQ